MENQKISFVSLGLVVLDEIRFPGREPLLDVLGGSGIYASLGARLFLPSSGARSVGCIFHVGTDFPPAILKEIRNWGTRLNIKWETNRPSTRGLLEYKDTVFGLKRFNYMTPVLTVGIDLVEESGALEAEVFHFLSSPQEAPSCVSALLDSRKKAGILKRPLIIWEPAPPFCRSEYLAACLEAARWVDVFSPNHFELLALWGKSPPSNLDKFQIESLAGKFIDSGVGPDGMGTVIIRAGEHGSMISLRGFLPKWLPPCYPSTPDGRQHPKVVDPTGAGNAFLGAYGIGLLITSDPVKAACYGSVGASFALEQVSVPKLAQDEDTELWNGTDVFARLGTYIKKLDPADLQNHFSPRYTA